MPPAADLIKLAFASGTAELNRGMLDHFASNPPDLPLVVVAEFAPHRGEWIPYHVPRSVKENTAAIRAAVAGRGIGAAAMVLAPGTALAKMRIIALTMAPASLIAYDERLRILRLADLPGYFLSQVKPGRRAQRWLRRMAHPAEAEIPLRARSAQVYGSVASRIRAPGREIPMPAAVLHDGVSVIVPSRDGRELLAALLPGLLAQIPTAEVIVVDNGSSDGTAPWLAREFPVVRVIETQEPLSFARAINAGILKARCRRVLMLNNDMIVEPRFIAALESAFYKVPGLFCATAQIFFPPGIRREETGKAVWRRENPLDFPVRCDEPYPGEDLTWVLYGSGGCSLFDTAKLRELGGVAEVYDPAYVEDMDFGYRAWKRGWPTVFCAGARVEHRHRATTSRFFTARQLDGFVERNYLRFLIHAVGSPALFRTLWMEAIRRLQLLAMNGNHAALDSLRSVPHIGPRPPGATGLLTEQEILALGSGDIAVFPGRAPRGLMPILVASPYLPFPLSHGGAVRIFNLMKHAAARHDLVLIAFCETLSTPPAELLALCSEVVLVRRYGSHYRRRTSRPDVVEEFDSAAFRACLKQTVERWKPAIVQLEFTQMAQYADACAGVKTILVEHDITFDLQQQLLAITPETGAARWELEQQLEKWRRFETAAWRGVDSVVTMSEKDLGVVTGAKSVTALPNGVDCERFQPGAREPEPKRLLFIGAFRHLPNVLALEYFLREVWPLLGPGYRLHVIAGAQPDHLPEYLNQPGIEVEGFVADVREAYQRAELVLAPLTASAGTNIKVLEAMAMGRVVVSSRAGINGLDLRPGCDVVVCGSAEEMAAEIRSLTEDAARRQTIERQARKTALTFDWREIGVRQEGLYMRAIAR
jgi:GT2 family glycosyltransferase/glycosyltransferase involved in cell wall biosynthesis